MFAHFKMIILFAILNSISLLGFAHSDSTNIVVHQVKIVGESNVSDFWILYSGKVKGQALPSATHLHSLLKSDLVFKFPINAFEAQNAQIKSNFRKMLKSEQYPSIFIRIDNDLFPLESIANRNKTVLVYITIGGIEKAIPIVFVWEKNTDFGRKFKGESLIHLNDFELNPPKILFGLIQLKESIMITFELESFINE